MNEDRHKMIIDIILNSNFFPQEIKNEVENFNNWDYKINKIELQHHYERIKNDTSFGPTKDNTIKINTSTTILKWSNGIDTILPMINKDLKEFNWYDEITKYKEENK